MPEDQPLEEMASGTGVDYDLTQMNGDMVYATDPSTYEGKTFRMEGLYTPIIVEDTGKIYHYCLIQDALACCAQGMEFVSGDGSHTDQSEYPPEDTDIIVEGIFETYREEDSGTGSVITFSDTISRPVSVPFLDVVSTVTS